MGTVGTQYFAQRTMNHCFAYLYLHFTAERIGGVGSTV